MAALPLSHLQIPEGVSGRFYIQHTVLPRGWVMPMAYGQPPVELPTDVKVHMLKEADGMKHTVWMSDAPFDIVTHAEALAAARGRVLTSGLGIGYFAAAAAAKDEVTAIDIVELNRDVVNLVWEHVRTPKMRLMVGDLFQVMDNLAREGRRYDLIYLDIWPSHDMAHLRDYVAPLRRKARPLLRPGGKTLCWVEREMRQQLADGLAQAVDEIKRAGLPPVAPEENDGLVLPFLLYLLDHRDQPAAALRAAAQDYADTYGTESWAVKYSRYLPTGPRPPGPRCG